MTHLHGDAWKTPGPWVGLFTGTAAPLVGLASAGAISLPWAFGLAVIPALLLIPLIRTIRNPQPAQTYGSAALKRYNFRLLASISAYVVGLMIAVSIFNKLSPTPPITFVISLLPTIPALAMVVVMGRYLIEETDEYLRHRTSLAAIIGLGLVLCLGTIWGFLETFGLVPNIFAWWVVPVWAIGLAIGQTVVSQHERKQEQD